MDHTLIVLVIIRVLIVSLSVSKNTVHCEVRAVDHLVKRSHPFASADHHVINTRNFLDSSFQTYYAGICSFSLIIVCRLLGHDTFIPSVLQHRGEMLLPCTAIAIDPVFALL